MTKRLPYLMLMLFLAVLAVPLRASPAAGAAQTQQPKPDQGMLTAGGQLKKPTKYSGAPILGEFQENQAEAQPERERRQLREERYSKSNLPRQVTDPGLLVDGKEETTNLRFVDYVTVGKSPDPRGIPASTSTAVVVGTILSGRCFVSHDHTYVYTDYQVKVDQVLKQDAGAGLSVGGELVAAREGGAVHFPSGHVTNFLTMGHGLPEIGSQYVLFLSRPNPSVPEYDIIFDAGYQLKGGRAYPLDDANYQYVSVEEAVLLGEIQNAIAASQNGGLKP